MSNQPLHTAIDVGRAEREAIRWVLLLALWHSRPSGTSEYVLLRTCQDIQIRVTNDQIRSELVSLQKRGLVTVARTGPVWEAELTAEGEAVVDYRADCPVDVARPPKW